MDTDRNNELIAAITAALELMNHRRTTKLIVTSIKRTTPKSPIWNVVGRISNLR